MSARGFAAPIAAAALLGACAGPPEPGRVTLRCAFQATVLEGGEERLSEAAFRFVWIDTGGGVFLLGAPGARGVDLAWAAQTRDLRQDHDGYAPIVRRSGSFFCLHQTEERVCRHGVDLESGAYAFTTPFRGRDHPQGLGPSAELVGRGRCVVVDAPGWPPPAPLVFVPIAQDGIAGG